MSLKSSKLPSGVPVLGSQPIKHTLKMALICKLLKHPGRHLGLHGLKFPKDLTVSKTNQPANLTNPKEHKPNCHDHKIPSQYLNYWVHFERDLKQQSECSGSKSANANNGKNKCNPNSQRKKSEKVYPCSEKEGQTSRFTENSWMQYGKNSLRWN